MNELIARGKRDEAVTYLMRTVGVPGLFVVVMRFMPFWKDAVAAAHAKRSDEPREPGTQPLHRPKR